MQMGQLAANPNLNGYYFIKYIVVSLLTSADKQTSATSL
jgi:hypothetical protein